MSERSTVTIPLRIEKSDVKVLDAIVRKRKTAVQEPPSRNAIIREMIRRGIAALKAEEKE